MSSNKRSSVVSDSDRPKKRGRRKTKVEGDTPKVKLTEEEREYRKTRLARRKVHRQTKKTDRELEIDIDLRNSTLDAEDLTGQCASFLTRCESAAFWQEFCESLGRLLPVYRTREEDEEAFESFFADRFPDFDSNEETRRKAQEGLARYLMKVVSEHRVEHPHMRRPSSKETKSKFDDLYDRLDDEDSLYPPHYNGDDDKAEGAIQYNYDDYPSEPCLGITTLQCQVNEASNAFHVDQRLSCGSDLCPSFKQAWFGDGYTLAEYFDSMNLMTKAMFRVNEDMPPHLFDKRRWITAFLANSSYKPAQFRPAAAKAIHRRLEGTKILDFCSGWGDRLAAAFSDSNVTTYLGCDPNADLMPRYLAQCACYDAWRFAAQKRREDEAEAKAEGRKRRVHKRVVVTVDQKMYEDVSDRSERSCWFPTTIQTLRGLIKFSTKGNKKNNSEDYVPREPWRDTIEGLRHAYDELDYKMPRVQEFVLANGRKGYDFRSESTGFRCVLITTPVEEVDWASLMRERDLTKFDLAFTSPPYSACEAYAKGTPWEDDQAWKKCVDSKGFFAGFIVPLVDRLVDASDVLFEDGARLCLNFHDTPVSKYVRKRYGLVEATFEKIASTKMFEPEGTICLRMARRPNCRHNPNLLREPPKIYGEPAFVWKFRAHGDSKA